MVELYDNPRSMWAWSDAVRSRGETVGLVPTMGALHDGHLSLIRLAQQRATTTVVSIFVNPLQFDRDVDFDAYPQSIDDDLVICEQMGVDAVYAPTASALYPPDFETTVRPGSRAATMEGAMRPDHFTGVATVVTKLFGAVRPTLAVFGEKDFQQLAVIRRMTSDLDLGVEIVAGPIVREPDGLALSSRNRRLIPEQRSAAVCVPAALDAAAAAVEAGACGSSDIEAAAAAVVAAVDAARLEYVTVFDPDTLVPVPELTAAPARIAIAVWFADIRLIDNRSLP
ncbi:MAG: pantoate--beta-alanine ligase [Actinomycetota bacterium]|nr:pantoate--beta-alanine ligase [Actinomycetota bacterium]